MCGQVDVNAATRSCIGSVSSLLRSILLLLAGLREVLINEALDGFACSKRSKLDLELEDMTGDGTGEWVYDTDILAQPQKSPVLHLCEGVAAQLTVSTPAVCSQSSTLMLHL